MSLVRAAFLSCTLGLFNCVGNVEVAPGADCPSDLSGCSEAELELRRCRRDAAPPQIAIAAPLDGATVSGALAMSGTASDDTVLRRVHVQVDDGPWAQASGTLTWLASLDTATLAPGPHRLSARATDCAGRTATASVAVSASGSPFDFTVALSGSTGTVTAVASLAVDVTATRTSGDAKPVTFSALGLPGGVTVAFVPVQCTLNCTARLQVSASPAAVPGSYPVTVVAQAGGLNRSATLQLIVADAATPSRITLAWDSSAGAEGYNLYRADAAGGPYAKLNSTLISSLTFTDATALAGKRYFFIGTAVGSGLESVHSNEAQGTAP